MTCRICVVTRDCAHFSTATGSYSISRILSTWFITHWCQNSQNNRAYDVSTTTALHKNAYDRFVLGGQNACLLWQFLWRRPDGICASVAWCFWYHKGSCGASFQLVPLSYLEWGRAGRDRKRLPLFESQILQILAPLFFPPFVALTPRPPLVSSAKMWNSSGLNVVSGVTAALLTRL